MHKIEISPPAFKFLEKLKNRHKHIADRIIFSIDNLKKEPFKGKKLVGGLSNFRSLRVGDYRIIYSIIQGRLLIQVIKVGHRRDIYRQE